MTTWNYYDKSHECLSPRLDTKGPTLNKILIYFWLETLFELLDCFPNAKHYISHKERWTNGTRTQKWISCDPAYPISSSSGRKWMNWCCAEAVSFSSLNLRQVFASKSVSITDRSRPFSSTIVIDCEILVLYSIGINLSLLQMWPITKYRFQ